MLNNRVVIPVGLIDHGPTARDDLVPRRRGSLNVLRREIILERRGRRANTGPQSPKACFGGHCCAASYYVEAMFQCAAVNFVKRKLLEYLVLYISL